MMADVSGTTTWAYDQRGRVTSETKAVTGGGSYTTAWTYTSADRVASMIYPKGSQTATSEIVTSNYLPQGTLTSLTSSLGSTYLSSAAVDAAGRATVFSLGNGTQTVYSYNAWTAGGGQGGRMQKLQSGTPESLTAGAPSLQSFQYTYDWAGNITDITQKVGSQSVETPHYDYDEINRLTSVTYGGNPITATYDANTGNLATKASKVLGYGTQAANCPGGALTKVHAAISLDSTTNTYCYDLNGNMTRRTIGANIYTLSYDPENRMTQISGGGGPVFDYVYNGDGQRVLVKQTSNGQTDQTIYIGGYFEVFIKASYTAPTTPPAPNCGIRRCVYFPLGILPTNPPATTGQVWKSYYSTGAGRVMRIQDNTNTGGGGGLFWLYADHLGSTMLTARLDGLGGGLISTLSYTAWGETRGSTGTTPTSIRYTGQREAEAGLYFYQARWYDPYLNRWTQPDSIVPDPGNPLSYDRYAYVYNNPINRTDPSGHWPEWSWVGEFFTGLATEFTRVNNWAGAIVSPGAAQSLAPSGGESDVMLAGRIVGDVLSVAVGVVEVSGGLGIAGGGAVVGCGTTLCLTSVPAIAGGVAVMSYGAETSLSSAAALGDNLGRMYSRRTDHGDQRASQGNRPTGQAWNDAQKAGPGKVYYDTETGYYIVDGDRGRAHVFKIEDGQLKNHTSFDNPAKNTLNRLMSGKWEVLSENQYNDWQNILNGTLNGD
jgi:RHS repeat-associated protein